MSGISLLGGPKQSATQKNRNVLSYRSKGQIWKQVVNMTMVSLKALVENLCHAFLSASGVTNGPRHSNLCHFCHRAVFSLCFCVSSSLQRPPVSHVGVGAYCALLWSRLNSLYLRWPRFQIRSHSKVLGSTWILGGHHTNQHMGTAFRSWLSD